jgi:hypothetical protein
VPDPQLPGRQLHLLDQAVNPQPQEDKSKYRIQRKGSRYNIQGPQGRIFSKYKSASVAGPRWEELTHTPWPYTSSAYESGLRLWELGLIPREQVGQTQLLDEKSARAPAPKPAKASAKPKPQRKKPPRKKTARKAPPDPKPEPAEPRPVQLVLSIPLALPAPRIDVEKQERMIQKLRQDPQLLFDKGVQEALRNEVTYNRPYAQRAETLLKVLSTYQARQYQRSRRPAVVEPHEILARHLAWQAQRVEDGQAPASV